MNSFKIPDLHRRTNNHTVICSLIVTCLSNLLLLTGCTTGLQDRRLRNAVGDFSVKWYDPLKGGALKTGTRERVTGGTRARLGSPPKGSLDPRHQDWVVLLKKTNE